MHPDLPHGSLTRVMGTREATTSPWQTGPQIILGVRLPPGRLQDFSAIRYTYSLPASLRHVRGKRPSEPYEEMTKLCRFAIYQAGFCSS